MRTCSSDRPVVSGEYDDEREQEGVYLQNRLFVVGPTSGRWARTRPVWNQWGYDVTSIRDDGTIVSFPFPNWASYNSFRAQPAHAGSVEAPAGAVVRVYTWTAALGLLEVDSATLPDAIGPGMSAAAVELDVPVAEWGDWRVLEVVGNGGEACDWVSNREEMDVPDPCGAEE